MVKKKKDKIKLKDIAEKAGVSAGTVDRVIHSRGEVNERTRQKVLNIIEELGYKPNLQARSLALKKTYRIFVLLPSAKQDNNPYWELPKKGIVKAAEETDDYNLDIILKTFSTNNKESFITVSNDVLLEEPDGIIFSPYFSDAATDFSNRCNENNIPYVLIDSNLENANALAYFGQDTVQSGYLSAKLMSFGLPSQTTILIVNITDSNSVSRHVKKREQGFLTQLAENNKNINTISLNIDLGHAGEPEKSLKEVFKSHPDIEGIFVTGSRVYKVAEFLNKTSRDTLLLGYDLIDENIDYLKTGTIDFLICQKPEEQGYKSIMAMTKHLIAGQEIPRVNYSQIDIITKENIDFYNKL